MADKSNIIIIKRIDGDGHGEHHGGGWKVAYADFITAMMAFFLLMRHAVFWTAISFWIAVLPNGAIIPLWMFKKSFQGNCRIAIQKRNTLCFKRRAVL